MRKFMAFIDLRTTPDILISVGVGHGKRPNVNLKNTSNFCHQHGLYDLLNGTTGPPVHKHY